jgi:hypothetical protein
MVVVKGDAHSSVRERLVIHPPKPLVCCIAVILDASLAVEWALSFANGIARIG